MPTKSKKTLKKTFIDEIIELIQHLKNQIHHKKLIPITISAKPYKRHK